MSPARLTRVALLSVLLIVLLRTGWIADDAFIVLRTIDNCLSGFGFRFNIHERVQAFTSPLWLLTLLPVVAVIKSGYFAALFVSISCSLVAAYLLLKRTTSFPGMLVVFAAFILSRSIVDFSTSGLENSLLHVLVLCFFNCRLEPTNLLRLTIVASALMLTRFDMFLVVLPTIFLDWRKDGWHGTRQILKGSLPFLAWMVFSLFYFGFPFPNTAYSKLGHGLATSKILGQGIVYLNDLVQHDPITILVLLVGITVGFFVRDRIATPLAFGLALHVVYVIFIGGDFMAGRFLAADAVLSLAIIAHYSGGGTFVWFHAIAGLSLLLLSHQTTCSIFSACSMHSSRNLRQNGIADERRWYIGMTGLVSLTRELQMPIVDRGLIERSIQRNPVMINDNPGMYGYVAGINGILIDRIGLTDPLLSRLPAKAGEWRIGHFFRDLPRGYLVSVQSAENKIAEIGLHEYYYHLLQVTTAPLFSAQRLKSIVMLNSGKLKHLLDPMRGKAPQVFHYHDLKIGPKPGDLWDSIDTIRFLPPGIKVLFDGSVHNKNISLVVDHSDSYEISIFKDDAEIWRGEFTAPSRNSAVLVEQDLFLPPAVVASGYNAMLIKKTSSDPLASLASITLY